MVIITHFSSDEDALKRRRKHQDVGIADKHDISQTTWLWRLGYPPDIAASSLSFIRYVQTIITLPKNDTTSDDAKTVAAKRSSSNLSSCFGAQVRGMFKDFRSNGLPWRGNDCRSVISGCSGLLFCLPAFFCKSNRLEQFNWVLQALLSVMADYVYIGTDSWIHGIDRFFATTNTFAIIARAAFALNSNAITIALIPISAFVLANRAKEQLDLKGWIFYHFLWHVTASVAVTVTVHLLFTCPDFNRDNANLESSPLYNLCG